MNKVLKVLGRILKKVCLGFLILYGFNLIVSAADVFIPINVVTVGAVSSLGIPGLFSLVAIYFITK